MLLFDMLSIVLYNLQSTNSMLGWTAAIGAICCVSCSLQWCELAAYFISSGYAMVFVVSVAIDERHGVLEWLFWLEIVIDEMFDQLCFIFMFTAIHTGISGDRIFIYALVGHGEW